LLLLLQTSLGWIISHKSLESIALVILKAVLVVNSTTYSYSSSVAVASTTTTVGIVGRNANMMMLLLLLGANRVRMTIIQASSSNSADT